MTEVKPLLYWDSGCWLAGTEDQLIEVKSSGKYFLRVGSQNLSSRGGQSCISS